MPKKTLSNKNRFLSKIIISKSSDCWEWQTAKNPQGYGWFSMNNQRWYAHRAAWVLFISAIPSKTLVLHHCDNPGCANPEHLFLGTHKDNTHDMIEKGRDKFAECGRKGELNGNAKLKETDVLEIKRLRLYGMSVSELAKMYSVSGTQIYRILSGKRWPCIVAEEV